MKQLVILLVCIVLTVLVSRVITFAVLQWRILPLRSLSNGRRFHHFVYGNFLILLTSFLVIAMGVDASVWWIVIPYGIGLGLILDEFPHWLGNVKELTRNVLIVPGALPAVAVAIALLVLLIICRGFNVL